MPATTQEVNRQAENARVLCVGVLFGLVLGMLSAAPAVADDNRVRVAILPIVVHSTTDREYLRSGLADMLTSRLGREKGLAVLKLDDTELATTDASVAKAAGGAAGASWVLYGSFTRFGEGASLDIRCVEVGGEDAQDPRSVFIQAGTLGEIIPRLDNLAKRVAHHVTSGRSSLPSVSASEEEAQDSSMASALDEIDALRARIQLLEDLAAETATEAVDQALRSETP
ncbi:MAG: hypothetical protein JRH01_15365 [Deltaproteobacteria bacterium]|nr:hypothetical protein [Deltaproteobacteria bacterium]MBW2394719.1 hypothetical protein [Deltaproteobacteria bacterium]